MQWEVANNFSLDLSSTPILMGILNITPDSFSDGANYLAFDSAIAHAEKMYADGAQIIDIGGESTRPGATPVPESIEQERILPIVKALSSRKIILSVDTYNSNTANAALNLGAHIINDVYGLQKDPQMAEVIASFAAGVVIMHTNRERMAKEDIIEDQKFFFDKSLTLAHKAGIKKESIVLDPGFGFGKDFKHNLTLFNRLAELKTLGYPILAGTSRKGFVRKISGAASPKDTDIATSVTSVLLRQRGVNIFRVHNIVANLQALTVLDAISGRI